MSWLGLLLIGVGLTDLLFSVRPRAVVPEASSAIVVVLLGLACDLRTTRDIVVLLLIAGVVVAWGQSVTRGFGRGPAWLPLAVLGAALTAAIGVSGLAGTAGGLLDDWLGSEPLPVLSGLSADEALLLAGVLLVQMSTGNVLVRLVLSATRTINPARGHRPSAPERALKGGRLLGPMERLLIVGLGLAGEITAASVVVAAKGLIRWPELQAAREDKGPGIHLVTEYFLVGSFVSWLVALGSLVLLAD